MTFEALTFVARLVVMADVRLRLVDLRLHIAVIAIVVAEIVTFATRHTAIHLGAALGNLLIAEGHDDAVVVLRVLQIVLGQHRVA
jgi:hypothetical protein